MGSESVSKRSNTGPSSLAERGIALTREPG